MDSILAGTTEGLRLHATVWEVIGSLWPVFVVPLAVTLVMTPLCRRFAQSHRIVDRPDDYLKPHSQPIAYLGGVAIFVGWAVGLGVAWWMRTGGGGETGSGLFSLDGTMMVGILVAGGAVMVIGLLDDLREVSAAGRLLATVALGVLLVACGIGDDFAVRLAHDAGLTVVPDRWWLGAVLSVPLSLFVLVGACNATNVLDGLDGLCAGVLSIAYAGYLGLGLYLLAMGDGHACVAVLVVVALAALGSTLGFLPYNRPKASIFMGDAGSMLLGLNAAVLILLLAESGQVKYALAGLVVFAVPVGDMALAMIRRRRSGKPMMQGDRSHFYDQLVDRGYSVPRVLVVAYGLAVGFALLGWAALVMDTGWVVLLYVAAAGGTVLAVIGCGMICTDAGPPSGGGVQGEASTGHE
ncbi:MAG: undecaprenyl/decaprenyl-phosphate alpha-N-acetylglucosaminyl 1-phosphate transferase [bacterium]|nr:undecaprenyl/decaprenyl-phosphate alpha-N-acetylglucosaminyl 1-phosphate transferase [bacterium]